jgi:hypothetical protein
MMIAMRKWLPVGAISLVGVMVIAVVLYSPISGGHESPNGGPVVVIKSSGDWNYTVSLNATQITTSQSVLVWGNLTYIGQNDTIVFLGRPNVALTVFNSSGGVVWAWTPILSTWKYMFTPTNSTFDDHAHIPAYTLMPGRYSVYVGPRLGVNSLDANLATTTDFWVV